MENKNYCDICQDKVILSKPSLLSRHLESAKHKRNIILSQHNMLSTDIESLDYNKNLWESTDKIILDSKIEVMLLSLKTIDKITLNKCKNNACKSPYPSDSVPIYLFYVDEKEEVKELHVYCIYCRDYSTKQIKSSSKKKKKKIKEDNKKILSEGISEYMTCPFESHLSAVKSSFARNKVPIIMFIKDPGNHNLEYHINCSDCRNYIEQKNILIKEKNEIKYNEMSQKLIDDGEENNYKVCRNTNHENYSQLNRCKIPIDMFIRNPEDDELLVGCSDCRAYGKIKYEKSQKKKKMNTDPNIPTCSKCNQELTLLNICNNKDGKQSKRCNICKNKGTYNNKKIREYFNDLKKQHTIKHQTSCMICNNIFIKNPGTNPPFIKTPIIIINNIKYIDYNNEIISVEYFLNMYHDLLELSVMEFDHLPEDEFNKLYPDKKFIPKVESVSRLSTETKMGIEAKKCQHLCCECHTKETIRREHEPRIPFSHGGDKLLESKKILIKIYKEKGCCLCGYNAIFRFLEFDHLDPSTKINHISSMISNYSYSLLDLQTEIEKCRVLCRYCHIFHTKNQREDHVI